MINAFFNESLKNNNVGLSVDGVKVFPYWGERTVFQKDGVTKFAHYYDGKKDALRALGIENPQEVLNAVDDVIRTARNRGAMHSIFNDRYTPNGFSEIRNIFPDRISFYDTDIYNEVVLAVFDRETGVIEKAFTYAECIEKSMYVRSILQAGGYDPDITNYVKICPFDYDFCFDWIIEASPRSCFYSERMEYLRQKELFTKIGRELKKIVKHPDRVHYKYIMTGEILNID